MTIKTAMITGGSRGIGKELSKILLNRGFKVFSISRSTNHGIDHENYVEIRLDLSDQDAVKCFLSDFFSEHGVPDVLVNNAGYGAFFEWTKFSDKDLNNQMQVLFTSPALFCRKFAPLMAKRKSGTIINLSSLAVLYPLPFMPIYNAAKSALSSLTQTLILEYNNHPKFIDFRMGDIKTSFNQSSLKQQIDGQNKKMKSAWLQIEKQLNHSPSPGVAAEQLISALDKGKAGIIYGGGFFQARIAPLLYNFTPNKILLYLLAKRYF
jgi:short-subunit dehydrogenase